MSSQYLPIRPLEHATRDAVFNALFSFCQTIPAPTNQAWKLLSQRLRQWDDVPATQQPAMFLFRGMQRASREHAYGVTKWKWHCALWIYYRVDGLKTSENVYPDQLTDVLIDSIEQRFQTDPLLGPNTLGDLVTDVWIDGNIVFDSGLTDGQAIVVVPLSILL